MSLRWVYHHRKENWRLYWSEIIGTASPRFACPGTQQNTTTFYHDRFVLLYYHLLVGTADLFFAWRYLFLLLSGSGREMMRYPISGSLQSCWIRLYITFYACDRSKQVFLFLLVLGGGWLWRAEDYFFPSAPGLLVEDGEASSALVVTSIFFSHSFGCTYSTGGISCISSKSYKLQKFKPSHHRLLRVCPQSSYPSIFPPTYLLTSHAYPSPILNLPITFHPLSRQYHPPDAITITTPQPRHHLTSKHFPKNSCSFLPNFGPRARRLGTPTLSLHPCPIPQPTYTYTQHTALNSVCPLEPYDLPHYTYTPKKANMICHKT